MEYHAAMKMNILCLYVLLEINITIIAHIIITCHHQVVKTEIRLIIFAAKDGEALYRQNKQTWELIVA